MWPKYWGVASFMSLMPIMAILDPEHTFPGNTELREDLLNGNRDNSEGLKYPRVASIESDAYHGRSRP